MKKPRAYLVIGCPGAGKSWVCNQLKDKFTYVNHDLHIGMSGPTYLKAIVEAHRKDSNRNLLIEAPFSISETKDPLERLGFEIIPVFIQEDHKTISDRYAKREGKPIPKGHLTRQNTYKERAKLWKSFSGTSEEVYKYLSSVK